MSADVLEVVRSGAGADIPSPTPSSWNRRTNRSSADLRRLPSTPVPRLVASSRPRYARRSEQYRPAMPPPAIQNHAVDMGKGAGANRGVARTRDGVDVRVLRPVKYRSLTAQRGETALPTIGEHVEIIRSHLIDDEHDDQPWSRAALVRQKNAISVTTR